MPTYVALDYIFSPKERLYMKNSTIIYFASILFILFLFILLIFSTYKINTYVVSFIVGLVIGALIHKIMINLKKTKKEVIK